MSFFLVKRVFNNLLIIKLELFEFIKIYFVFCVSLLRYAAQDSLFD